MGDQPAAEEATTSLIQDETTALVSEQLTRHEVAAWLVDESTRDTSIESIETVPRDRRNRSTYLFFKNTAFIRRSISLLLIFLSFCERPSWCPGPECLPPAATDIYLSGIPYLSPNVALLINLASISVLLFFALFDRFITPVAWQRRPNLLGLYLVLLVADAIYEYSYEGSPPFRLSPFLRAALLLFYWEDLYECTSCIAAVIRPFLTVAFFIIAFTLFSGLVVTLLFHEVPAAKRYFGDLRVGLFSAFMALAVVEWPAQLIGILETSPAAAFLFVAFIVVGVFLLLNVLLAVVYKAYTAHMESVVLSNFVRRKRVISLAFDVLTEEGDPATTQEVRLMFENLRHYRRDINLDEERLQLLFTALDDNADNALCRKEFCDVVDVMQLQFEVEAEACSPMQRFFPAASETPLWKALATCVRTDAAKQWERAFMAISVAVVAVDAWFDLTGRGSAFSNSVFAFLEAGIVATFAAGVTAQLAVLGGPRFFADAGLQYDLYVTTLGVLSTLYLFCPWVEAAANVARIFILLRCLRLLEVLTGVRALRRLVRVFSVVLPASVPLFSLLALSLFMFAAAGVELYGGLIYKGNAALEAGVGGGVIVDGSSGVGLSLAAPFVEGDLWVLNFNDLASAWFTMFCTVVCGFLTEVIDVVGAASSRLGVARAFFITSFVFNSLIVTNCVVAFVVDLFLMENADDDDDEEVTFGDEGLHQLQRRYGKNRVKILHKRLSADEVYANMFRERLKEALAVADMS